MRCLKSMRECMALGVVCLLLVLFFAGLGRAKVIYVDDDAPIGGDGSSWFKAYRFLQDALADANGLQEVVEIRIAQGVYQPDRDEDYPEGTRDRKAVFAIGSSLNTIDYSFTLKGGYAGLQGMDPNQWDVAAYMTVLSGDLLGNDREVDDPSELLEEPTRADNSLRVVWIRGSGYTFFHQGGPFFLEGLTICGGHCDVQDSSHAYYPDSDSGGGLHAKNLNITLTDCTFVCNSAVREGGGMYLRDGDARLYRCHFISNVALSSLARGGGGGLACFDESCWWDEGVIKCHELHLNECEFIANRSSRGAGLKIRGKHVFIEGSRFVGNAVPSDYYGNGGAMNFDGSETVMRNCMIIDNSANNGGGINVTGDLTISGSVFSGNYASSDGGGIKGGGGSTSVHLVIRDSLICGNRAGVGWTGGGAGGGISISGPTIMSNCTISHNWASHWGGGISCTNLSITNSILYGNISGNRIHDSAQIYSHNRPLSMSWNCIQGLSGALTGLGNMDADPCFADPGYWMHPDGPDMTPDLNDINTIWVEGDYHLKSQGGRWDPMSRCWVLDEVTSPCIDAADSRETIGHEPFPNGGRRNMGFYGATVEASKSYFGQPPCETILAGDINGDCRVDLVDYELLLMNWMGNYSPGSKVTTTYVFSEEVGSASYGSGRGRGGELQVRGNRSSDLYITGCFSLSVDANTGVAWISEMKASLNREIGFSNDTDQQSISTNELAVLYRVDELVSTQVTEQEVVLECTDSSGNLATMLKLTFQPGSVQLAGLSFVNGGNALFLHTRADVEKIIIHED